MNEVAWQRREVVAESDEAQELERQGWQYWRTYHEIDKCSPNYGRRIDIYRRVDPNGSSPQEFAPGERVRIADYGTWHGEMSTIVCRSTSDPQMYWLKAYGWRSVDELELAPQGT